MKFIYLTEERLSLNFVFAFLVNILSISLILCNYDLQNVEESIISN